MHKNHAQSVLLQSEHTDIAKEATKSDGAPCVVGGQQLGQLSGILSIPALHLTAPVEEGTDDPELAVAVGHDPQSVWPGATGAAVFLAHDVSYFVHLNALKPGDVITYQTACNTVKFVVSGQQVVQAGSSVANTSNSSLVLDTCYPSNALFFTPQRLLVRANEVSATTNGEKASGSTLAAPAPGVNYTTTAPAALVAQGLTLQQNEAPMGTMQLVNDSLAFAQSPGPLALEAAALQA
jgi:sortase A